MEDLGDFLYIIFAIIGVVYSILKKSNKKAQEATPPIMSEEDDFLDEDDGFLDEKPVVIREEVPVYEKKEVQVDRHAERPKKFFVREPAQKREADQAMIEKKKQMANSYTRVKNTQSRPKVQVEGEQGDIGDNQGLIDFNLRQAVIYSEILKRPEF